MCGLDRDNNTLFGDIVALIALIMILAPTSLLLTDLSKLFISSGVNSGRPYIPSHPSNNLAECLFLKNVLGLPELLDGSFLISDLIKVGLCFLPVA